MCPIRLDLAGSGSYGFRVSSVSLPRASAMARSRCAVRSWRRRWTSGGCGSPRLGEVRREYCQRGEDRRRRNLSSHANDSECSLLVTLSALTAISPVYGLSSAREERSCPSTGSTLLLAGRSLLTIGSLHGDGGRTRHGHQFPQAGSSGSLKRRRLHQFRAPHSHRNARAVGSSAARSGSKRRTPSYANGWSDWAGWMPCASRR